MFLLTTARLRKIFTGKKGVATMKLKIHFAITSVFSLLFFVLVAMGDAPNNESQPTAFLPEVKYEFLPVVEGTQVMHEFVIQNKGSSPLSVDKVLTG